MDDRKDDNTDRLKIPLDPEEALSALLEVDPDCDPAESESDEAARRKKERAAGDKPRTAL